MNTNVSPTQTGAPTAAPALSNEKAYDADRRKLFNTASSIGKEGGTGARSLAKLAKVALLGAYESLFSLAKPAAAKGVVVKDDAAKLYAMYLAGYSSKNEHGSVSQQESKLRAFMKVGFRRDFDAVDEFNRWSRMWADARNAESAAKKKTTEPEYKALYKCAIAQISDGQKGPLSDDQIDAAIRIAGAGPKTFEDFIKAAYKNVEKAVSMEANDDAEDAARLLSKIMSWCEDREIAAAEATKQDEEMALLAALQAKYAVAAE